MGREVWLTISSLQDICLKSGLKKRRWGARLENDLGFSVFPSENANALKERREVILPILGAGWIMRFQLHFCLLLSVSLSSFLVVISFVWLSFILFFWLYVFRSDPPHIGWWLDYAIVEFDFHKIASRDPDCWRVGNWQILPDGSFCRCRNLILSIPTRISPHRPEDMEIHNSGLKLHGFGVLMQYLSLATRW